MYPDIHCCKNTAVYKICNCRLFMDEKFLSVKISSLTWFHGVRRTLPSLLPVPRCLQSQLALERHHLWPDWRTASLLPHPKSPVLLGCFRWPHWPMLRTGHHQPERKAVVTFCYEVHSGYIIQTSFFGINARRLIKFYNFSLLVRSTCSSAYYWAINRIPTLPLLAS